MYNNLDFEKVFNFILISACIFVPLGTWKFIEIIFYLNDHLFLVWK